MRKVIQESLRYHYEVTNLVIANDGEHAMMEFRAAFDIG